MNKHRQLLFFINLFILLALFLTGITIINTNFKKDSEKIYTNLESFLTPIFSSAFKIADDRRFINWFENGENKKELEFLIIDSLSLTNISGIDVASSISGITYQTGGTTVVLDQENDRDKWYFDLMEDNNMTSVELYYDSKVGLLYIYYNVKVENNGDILGVLGFFIEYDNIAKILNNSNQLATAYLVNTNGEIYIHSDQTKIGNIDIYDYYGLLQKKQRKVQIIHEDNKNILKSVFSIPHLESYLIITKNYNLITFLKDPLLMIISILMFLDIIFIIFLFNGFSRKKKSNRSSR